jgi:catechol 2,3-dioxygenase-like lactoylglutathione lyase family enzyme
VVFQTNQIARMRDWYCTTLDAQVVHEDEHLCFITYDDEHHRIAFADFGPLARRPAAPDLAIDSAEPPGLHHVAFTYGAMGEFLDNYVRLRDLGIVPFRCINHGPTTSMYYRDPDGNRVELQIDNFATAQEGRDWLKTPAFAENPIGVDYDPDQLVARFRSGVPVAELVVRD